MFSCHRCWWREANHTTPFHGCSFDDFKGYEKRIRLWSRGFYDAPEGPRYTDEEVDALISDDQIPSYYDMRHACSGVSILCEHCWKKLKPLERLKWYRKLFKIWREQEYKGPRDDPHTDYGDTERNILRATASVLNGY